jgi:hypothetical protein
MEEYPMKQKIPTYPDLSLRNILDFEATLVVKISVRLS